MEKSWIKVDIYTSSEGVESLSSALSDLGHHSLSVVDAADLENLMEGKYGAWDYIDPELMKLCEAETTVTLYIQSDDHSQKSLSKLLEMLAKMKASDFIGAFGRLECKFTDLIDENWAESWKDGYNPIIIGEKLVVCTSWSDFNPKGCKKLIIDPGMAFGTGIDETTRLCLEALERMVVEGCSVLDVGCGSGILAIGALLLGADSALGIDVDKTAVTIAKENSGLNDVANKSEFIHGNPVDLVLETYDVVCANISADTILSLMPEFPRFLKNGGILILSGITQNREQDVINALLGMGLSIVECYKENDWSCIVAGTPVSSINQ